MENSAHCRMKGKAMKTSICTLIFALTLVTPFSHATPVNINAADATQLAQALKGVGLFKAKAIIRYRTRHGRFDRASDIISVKGIGRATYEKNRRDILIK